MATAVSNKFISANFNAHYIDSFFAKLKECSKNKTAAGSSTCNRDMGSKCFPPKTFDPMQTTWKNLQWSLFAIQIQKKTGNSYRNEAVLFNILLPERG
jgi:hypothetical protein